MMKDSGRLWIFKRFFGDFDETRSVCKFVLVKPIRKCRKKRNYIELSSPFDTIYYNKGTNCTM